MSNILVTTFGATWAVAAELLTIFSPGLLDLLKNNQKVVDFQKKLSENNKFRLDELWLICTQGETTDVALTQFKEWINHFVDTKLPLVRYLSLDKLTDLTNEEECRQMADFIYRTILKANHVKEDGKLILSLTGGRKTMSTDMQRAADLFGCDMLIHVAENNFRLREIIEFTTPLNPEEANKLFIVEVKTDKTKNIITEMVPAIATDDYPIEFSRKNSAQLSLYQEILKRLETSEYVHYNAYKTRTSRGLQSVFHGLQQLSPEKLKELDEEKPAYEWLKALPKTDLHCHFGGILHSDELVTVALANEKLITECAERHEAFRHWKEQIKKEVESRNTEVLKEYLTDKNRLRNLLFPEIQEPLVVSAFISAFQNDIELLDQIIFSNYQQDEKYRYIGIRKYEKLGDLQGSALLQNQNAIAAACQVLLRQCEEHNIKYLELRCSPCNYTRGGLTGREVVECMFDNLASHPNCDIRLIIIGSRHGDKQVFEKHVSLTLELLKDEKYQNFIVGFDVAGNEAIASPSELRVMMLPLLKECLHVTIHAGEDQPVENIWEAVYELNTDRVGHGLTLIENEVLLKRFRDRNIFIELCPSSNFQICDYNLRSKTYPLREYMTKGLKVTLNTDNPGISRTTITKEYQFMSEYAGLSKIEVLQLLRNSFQAVFLPKDEKKSLMLSIENELYKLIINPKA